MTTHGGQMDKKWTGSGLEVTESGPEVGQKWTGFVHLSVHTSVHPKHFPYLFDEPYARDLQAQGTYALQFLSLNHNARPIIFYRWYTNPNPRL